MTLEPMAHATLVQMMAKLVDIRLSMTSPPILITYFLIMKAIGKDS
jgi:hypothetical protein